MESKYGKGKTTTLNNLKQDYTGINFIHSGSLYFDEKLGRGWPMCTMAEIIGEEQAGKTTECLHILANAQKQYPDKYCSFVDVEHRFDPEYAERIGVDVNRLLVSQPEFAEEALDMVEDMIREQECSVVILDSIAGLVPREELEKPLSEGSVSKLPMLMGRATRKYKNIVRQARTLLVFTNQWRIAQFQPYVMKDTPGGKAVRYFSSIRVELKRESALITGTRLNGAKYNAGQLVNVHVKKNSFAPPFRKTQFTIMFGEGICLADELIDLGIEMDIIEKSGTWYRYGEHKIQGKWGFLQYIKENQKLQQELVDKAKGYLFDKKQA